MAGYEKFWDIISVEKTLYNSAERRGLAKGIAEGMEKGIAEGMEKGLEEGRLEACLSNARRMKEKGLDCETIADITGLTLEDIINL